MFRISIAPKMIDPFTEGRATAIVLRSRNGSTSHLARSMKVSWNEALRIMERLQAAGFVTRPDKFGRRIVLHPANDRR